MKILNKIAAVLSAVAVMTLSSCSDKGYWDKAPLEPGLSFQCAQYNETLTPGAVQFVIPLDRTVNTSQETVNLKFTPGDNCPTDITVPGSVTFEAGSNTANIVISIADATPPYTYSGKLEFEGTASYSGISSIEIKCPVSYTWSSMGTGAFVDWWVMGEVEDMYSVEILKADGFNRYRVVNPYKEYLTSELGYNDWEDWIASTGPAYIEFWEQADGSLMFNAFATGLMYEAVSGQSINEYPYTAFTNGQAGYDVWVEPGHAALSPFIYIPNVGGWGQQGYSLEIVLP